LEYVDNWNDFFILATFIGLLHIYFASVSKYAYVGYDPSETRADQQNSQRLS